MDDELDEFIEFTMLGEGCPNHNYELPPDETHPEASDWPLGDGDISPGTLYAFDGRTIDGFRYLIVPGIPFPGVPVATPPAP